MYNKKIAKTRLKYREICLYFKKFSLSHTHLVNVRKALKYAHLREGMRIPLSKNTGWAATRVRVHHKQINDKSGEQKHAKELNVMQGDE